MTDYTVILEKLERLEQVINEPEYCGSAIEDRISELEQRISALDERSRQHNKIIYFLLSILGLGSALT